jgi:hypothetical protein
MTEREELIEILENPKLDSSGNFEQWHISHGAKSLADAILEWHKKGLIKARIDELIWANEFYPTAYGKNQLDRRITELKTLTNLTAKQGER